jgi:tRNA pseudouridine38-40 synthase
VGVIRLTIAYDGGPFAGWAAQPGRRTIQGEIEAALARILGRATRLTVAGRTDAGVHAWGQVASFALDDEPPPRLARSLNALLPDEISVLDARRAADGFDARRGARSRTYCYWVVAAPALSPFERGRALWVEGPLDREALDRCASAVGGTHDFTAFTPTETEHVRFERRVLACEWRRFPLADVRPGELLELWVEADAFMRHMVRVLVGTMLEVGRGRRTVAEFEALLAGAPRERAGATAPAQGLYLASVRYER